MFTNYLSIAIRNLLARKGFSVINILGLSVGMTCCLLIFQYVAFEYSFDRFHSNEPSLYRVLQAYAPSGEIPDKAHAFTAQSLAPALAEGAPEIVEITRVHSDNAIVSSHAQPERVFEEKGVLYSDAGFMRMFTFPMVPGSVAMALQAGTMMPT